MKAIYETHNGNIIAIIPKHMDYRRMFKKCREDFINNLDEVPLVSDLNYKELPHKYCIKNRTLVKYTEQELREKRMYGKILTNEERLLEKLKPSPDEVKKAENTIEILTLLQEVM